MMQRRLRHRQPAALGAATLALAALALAFAPTPAMAIEEPAFGLVERDGAFELREYAPHVVAETRASALIIPAALFSSVHLSDNNRFFPGRGAISFGPIIGALRRIGWIVFLAIEGNTVNGLLADARAAVEALAPHLT